MKSALLLSFAVLLTTPAFALKEFYSISRSVRSLGMGGAYYALSNDAYALFYNPAGLSFYTGEEQYMFSTNFQMSQGGMEAINDIRAASEKSGDVGNIISSVSALQGKPVYLGFGLFPYYLGKNKAIGLLLFDTKAQFGFLGKELDSSVDMTVLSDTGLFLAYGKPVTENLHLGITSKMMYRLGGRTAYSVLELATAQTLSFDPQRLGGMGGGLDFDLGAIYELPKHWFGGWADSARVSLTLTNIVAGELIFKQTGSPPRYPRYVSLGTLFVLPGVASIDRFHLLLDFAEFGLGGQADANLGARTGSFWKRVNWGIEAPIKGWAFPRVGFHQGLFTLGLGLDFTLFKTDFAWYAEEVSEGINRLSSRRFALTLTVGFAPPPPIVPSDPDKSGLHEATPQPPGEKETQELLKVMDRTEPPPKEEPEKKGESSEGDAGVHAEDRK